MSQCGIEWSDGWSPEHICRKLLGHSGDHRCQCDAFTSQWMVEHGDEELFESAEEARIRLRNELLALQGQEPSNED
jgi:hypothetical protein